jgi:hypothetical protein
MQFMPTNLQMPLGMVAVGLYAAVLLVAQPYVRSGDDRLHLTAQAYLFLLLLSGHTMYNLTPGASLDPTIDAMMSVLLVGLLVAFLMNFVLRIIKLMRKFRYQRLRKQRAQMRGDDYEDSAFKNWNFSSDSVEMGSRPNGMSLSMPGVPLQTLGGDKAAEDDLHSVGDPYQTHAEGQTAEPSNA